MATRIELERVDLAVQKLQQDRANLDGRLMVISALTSVFVSAVIILVLYWVSIP